MTVIKSAEDRKQLTDGNRIVGDFVCDASSQINFKGKNNILFCNGNVNLFKSTISFYGNDSLVFLSENKHNYMLKVEVYSNSLVFFGSNSYFNGILGVIAAEHQHVFFGDNCLIAHSSIVRVTDAHPVYDCATGERLNLSKSIYFGDHVWLGQHSLVLKGTQVGSGSIIGSMSVVAGKRLLSNASYAGNPVRLIKAGVFFLPPCVNGFNEDATESSMKAKNSEYIYKPTSGREPFNELESRLAAMPTAQQKLDFIAGTVVTNKDKNRYALAAVETKDTGAPEKTQKRTVLSRLVPLR